MCLSLMLHVMIAYILALSKEQNLAHYVYGVCISHPFWLLLLCPIRRATEFRGCLCNFINAPNFGGFRFIVGDRGGAVG